MPSGVRIFAISGTFSRQKLCGRSSTTSRANSNTSGFRGSFGPRFRLALGEALAGRPADQRVELPDPHDLSDEVAGHLPDVAEEERSDRRPVRGAVLAADRHAGVGDRS